MSGSGSYEVSNCAGSFAVGDDGADAAQSAWSAAEYSESGAEYSGRAAGAFTGSEYAWIAEFSVAGSESAGSGSTCAPAEYSGSAYGSGSTTSYTDACAEVSANRSLTVAAL